MDLVKLQSSIISFFSILFPAVSDVSICFAVKKTFAFDHLLFCFRGENIKKLPFFELLIDHFSNPHNSQLSYLPH